MGDFIRFILTDEHGLTLALIEGGLKEVDPMFSILPDQAAPTSGDVLYAAEVFGEIEFDLPGEQVFQEDIEDLRDQLSDLEGEGKALVLRTLDEASGMIAFQLSEEGHQHYGLIDPFWDWLFDHHAGLLQIDEEGYYTHNEQILAVE